MMMMNRSSSRSSSSSSSCRRSRKQAGIKGGRTDSRETSAAGPARPAGQPGAKSVCKILSSKSLLPLPPAPASQAKRNFAKKINLIFKNSKRKRNSDFGGFQSPQVRTKKRKKKFINYKLVTFLYFGFHYVAKSIHD